MIKEVPFPLWRAYAAPCSGSGTRDRLHRGPLCKGAVAEWTSGRRSRHQGDGPLDPVNLVDRVHGIFLAEAGL